jgi:hypothetical protein
MITEPLKPGAALTRSPQAAEREGPRSGSLLPMWRIQIDRYVLEVPDAVEHSFKRRFPAWRRLVICDWIWSSWSRIMWLRKA